MLVDRLTPAMRNCSNERPPECITLDKSLEQTVDQGCFKYFWLPSSSVEGRSSLADAVLSVEVAPSDSTSDPDLFICSG